MNIAQINPEDIPATRKEYSEARAICQTFLDKDWAGMQVYDWQGRFFTDDEYALRSAAVNVRAHIKKEKLPIRVLVRGKCLYLVRTDDGGTEADTD